VYEFFDINSLPRLLPGRVPQIILDTGSNIFMHGIFAQFFLFRDMEIIKI